MRPMIRMACRIVLGVCTASASGISLAPATRTSATASSTWYWQNPLPRDYQLSAITCRSAASCVAVGAEGAIVTTDDGGQHWTIRTTGIAVGLSHLACPDSTVCYALGSQASSAGRTLQNVPYVLLWSINGGRTWQVASRFQANTQGFISSFDCPNPTTCLAGALHYAQPQAASILRTADGGKTWQSLQLAGMLGISTVNCATSTVCYASGMDKVGGRLFRSEDSGKTWSAGGLKSPGGDLRMACLNANTCFGAASTCVEGCSGIFLTTNGAKSWKNVADNPGGHLMGDLACPSVTTCYALVASGSNAYYASVVATTNGGKTWSMHRLPDSASKIVCPSQTTCLLNAGFTVLVTKDGFGHTHETLARSPLHNLTLTDISCPSTTACYAASLRHACGSNGGECNQVASPGAMTANGGRTWTQTPAPPDLIARLRCPSVGVCYSIAGETGASGFVERSGDGTRTWQRMFPSGGLYANLSDLSCPSVTTCYVTASLGGPEGNLAVLATDDAGKTWKVQRGVDALAPGMPATTPPRVLASVSCLSVTTCFVLAASFHQAASNPQFAPQWTATVALLTTRDGGTTWTRKSVPDMKAGDSPGSFIPPLACPTATTCYLLLSNGDTFDPSSTGDVLVTQDGGASWRRTTVQAKAVLTDMACSTAQACWTAGWSGIFATTDGGKTWQRQVMAGGEPVSQLSSIACPAAITCYAVGGPFFTDVTIVGTRSPRGTS